jgi:hypothetical protein
MRNCDFEEGFWKIFQKIIGLWMMIVSTVLLLVVLWMMNVPGKILDLKSVEVTDIEGNVITEVLPGQDVCYKLKLRKYYDLPSEIRVSIVNKFITSYPVYFSNIKKTDAEKVKDKNYWDVALARIQFPNTAKAGEHYMAVQLTYRNNPFNTKIYSIFSKKFMVKEDGKEREYRDEPVMIKKFKSKEEKLC